MSGSLQSNDNALAVIRLTKSYRGRRAIDGLSLFVPCGSVFGFLGPNGSGKTTTIGIVAGLIKPDSGVVCLLGSSDSRGLRRARSRIGVALERPAFLPHLTGLENLEVVARLKGVSLSSMKAVLNRVRLEPDANKKFSAYSTGMKQKLALASALLGDPQLLIMDEPGNGLDPDAIRELRNIVREVADAGTTIFISSHLLSEVERTCSHAAIIRDGRLVEQFALADLNNTQLVEIRSDNIKLVRAALEELPQVRVVAATSRGIRLHLDRITSSDVNRFLSSRGLYASAIIPLTKSLDDVFAAATSFRSGDEILAGGVNV